MSSISAFIDFYQHLTFGILDYCGGQNHHRRFGGQGNNEGVYGSDHRKDPEGVIHHRTYFQSVMNFWSIELELVYMAD